MNQPPPYAQFPRQAVSYAYPPPNPYHQQPGSYHQYAGSSVPTAPLTTTSSQQQSQIQQQQQQQQQQQHQPTKHTFTRHSSSAGQPQPPVSSVTTAPSSQHRSAQSSLSQTSSLQSSLSTQQRLVQQQTPPLTSPLSQLQQPRLQPPLQQHHAPNQTEQHVRPFLPPTQSSARPQLRQTHTASASASRSNARPGNVSGQHDSSIAVNVLSNSHQSALIEGPGSHGHPAVEYLDEVCPSAVREHSVDKGQDDDHDDDHDDPMDADEPMYNLPPPPESNYPGEADLEKVIHAWSLQHGYELVRRASKKNAAGSLYKRYYHCSKHGKIANTGKLTEKTRVRTNRRSNRMGCPMSIAAVAVDPSNPAGEWQIRHRKTHHNHGPLEAVTMAGHRRRARMGGVEKAVDGLFAIGTSTMQVLQFLQRTNPNGLFTRTDVANMKLKYNKFGTCVKDEDSGRQISGVPSACLPCRAKKQRCDSARPICGSCIASNAPCEYDHEPAPPQEEDVDQGTNTPAETSPAAVEQPPVQTSKSTPHVPHRFAQQILADLQSFQKEHVQPSRLTLQSSSVEILAQSSCGNGDSYRKLARLQAASDWTAYSDSMVEASLKENTYDVLTGTKHEPQRPDEAPFVDDWNEYVKQLAIFNRRNSSLLGAIWGTIGPSFRSRIQGMNNAHAVWIALEETCLPRGSDQAFRLYLELTSISLQNSTNLRDYIARLEASHSQLLRLKVSKVHERRVGRPPNTSSHASTPIPQTTSAVFPEDQLCLFFLRNLGVDWRPWVDKMCVSSNIAGFGTGPKIGWQDLTRQAIEFEAMQSRPGNGFSRS